MMKEKIAAVEAQMTARLKELRVTFTHPGDKGVSIEDIFRKFLCEYLPRKLTVGSGEVIDSNWNRSKQTDIVIVNEYHPFTFTQDLPGLFFIEGVCAAGEIKANLTSTELEKSINNSFNFKQLGIVVGKNTMVSSNESDLKRFNNCPPYFLIAFESQLKLSSILDRVINFMNSKGLQVNEINKVLDAIYIMNQGWVINFGDGKGSYQFRTPEGKPIEGWVWKESKTVLFDFLGWLSIVMPSMVRFEPILPLYLMPKK